MIAPITAPVPAQRHAPNAFGLSAEQLGEVEALAERDREVREHEQAHVSVGGAYAGRPVYDYQVGPDGRRYAVGGEVALDVAPIDGDPEATVAKMDIVKRAALAPPEPSDADRAIAALAEARASEARAEIRAEGAAESAAGAAGIAPADVAATARRSETAETAAEAAQVVYGLMAAETEGAALSTLA